MRGDAPFLTTHFLNILTQSKNYQAPVEFILEGNINHIPSALYNFFQKYKIRAIILGYYNVDFLDPDFRRNTVIDLNILKQLPMVDNLTILTRVKDIFALIDLPHIKTLKLERFPSEELKDQVEELKKMRPDLRISFMELEEEQSIYSRRKKL